MIMIMNGFTDAYSTAKNEYRRFYWSITEDRHTQQTYSIYTP